jgi:anionic cell wall polymer biosynthesis LytR-Cps2A-Psr (LCP) family protein
MKKILKWIVITFLTIVTIVILAGIYKFNYLASQEGYDCDGNKIIMPVKND